jgi:hypothetical protein
MAICHETEGWVRDMEGLWPNVRSSLRVDMHCRIQPGMSRGVIDDKELLLVRMLR